MRLKGITPSMLMAAVAPLLLAGSAIARAGVASTPTAASSEAMPLGASRGILGGGEEASSISLLDAGGGEFLRVLLALGVVIGLLLLLRWCIRRGSGFLPGGGRPQGLVKVHARYPMGKGQHLLLLQAGDRMLLVHQSSGRMQTLTEFSDEREVSRLHEQLDVGGETIHASSHSMQRPGGDQVVDLTSRGPVPGWRRLLGWRQVS